MWGDCPSCGFSYGCRCAIRDLQSYERNHRYEMGYDDRRCLEDKIANMKAEERRREEREQEEAEADRRAYEMQQAYDAQEQEEDFVPQEEPPYQEGLDETQV